MPVSEADLTDAKLAAAEARTDTKFAQLQGELKAINTRLEHLPGTWTLVTTIVGTGVGIVGLVLAALAFGSGSFGQGMSAADVAHKAAVEALAHR